MFHEHTRPDRDDYITVLYENIDDAKESNFDIHPESLTYGYAYDYGSVMHYGPEVSLNLPLFYFLSKKKKNTDHIFSLLFHVKSENWPLTAL